jgi:hypothetical protein
VPDDIGGEPIDPQVQAILGVGGGDEGGGPLDDLSGEAVADVGDMIGTGSGAGQEQQRKTKTARRAGPVGVSVRSLTAPLPLSVLIRCGAWWAARDPEAPEFKGMGEAERLSHWIDHATAEHSLWSTEGVECPHCGTRFVPPSEFCPDPVQYDEEELHMQGLRELWGQEIERQAAARTREAQAHMLAVLRQCQEAGQNIEQAIAALTAAGIA